MASASENIIQLDNSKCRICLFSNQNLCPLFKRGLSMKVMKLAEIKMYEGDGLPSSICLDCEFEVKRCIKFIARIQMADAKLKEMLAKKKELSAAYEKEKESVERLAEREEQEGEASTYQGDTENNDQPEDTNELNPLDNIQHNDQPENTNEPNPLIEIEEFNVKQEITSLDNFISEKEEVHSESDHDHFGEDIENNEQQQDENILNPINHVDIVEDRNRGDGMDVSNDPLGQEEPLIETQKNENDPSVDPLTCMKQEVVPMDIDKDTTPTASGSSSSVRRTQATISSAICPQTLDKGKGKEFSTGFQDVYKCNSSVLNITTSNEDKCQLQEPFPYNIVISSVVSGQSEGNESFCRICDLDYGSYDLLNKHKENNGFICRICGTEFDQHSELETHFQIHYTLKCGKCKESVLTRKDLDSHWRKKHSSEIFQCNICNKTYTRSRNLRKHQSLEHSNTKINWECVVCRKKFNGCKPLDEHLKNVHFVYESIECELCNSTSLGPDRIKKHMRTVHSDSIPARCETCGKVYKSASFLTNHQKTHDKSEKLCGICGKSIKGENSMKYHMKNEHSSKGEYSCKFCNNTFSDKILLIAHRRKFHKKLSVPKPVFCEICGKLFKSSCVLKWHKITHTDEKLFKCNICGASFKYNGTLRTHQRVHSSIGKYFCDYCGKSFKWKQPFTRHVQNCNVREKGGQNQ